MSELRQAQQDRRAYRADKFKVPQPAREEFLGRARETHEFLRTLDGFIEDLILEQADGPGQFNIVTIVTWRDVAALDAAREAVTNWRRELGFDPRETINRLGIDADLASYQRIG